MNINSLVFQPTLNPIKDISTTGSNTNQVGATNSFDSFYKAYLNLMDETNEYQITADKAQVDYVTGKTDDMLSVLLAQEKAYASLNFTVQITNKVIEAYREIMRISL